jgi:hypothetical protein
MEETDHSVNDADTNSQDGSGEDNNSSDDDDDGQSNNRGDDNNDDGQETLEIDDVPLSFSQNGYVFERSSQLEDYKLRANELSQISLWEFVSTVDQTLKPTNWTDEEPDEDLEEDENTHDQGTCTGPYNLHVEHRDYLKKIQRVRVHHWKHFVPVPIGPALPRCDRPKLYPKYARLMLIFFKPWRTEADLRGDASDWPDAFAKFTES